LRWPANKPFRILSLDGGGIRGIYAATMLARVEAKITKGEPIADYFDTIAGTSTGGIIALGLGLKKSAAKIQELYTGTGDQIFPEFWTRHPKLKRIRQLFRVLHDHRVLERLLYTTFQDARVGDSSARLVIPAFLGPKTQIAVLKTDHHPDFQKDHLMAAWEAARATSAAPAFFSGHGEDDYVFLDGGVWANNPIMAAVVDTLSAYDVSRDQIEIFSIGTGNAPYEISKFAVRGGFFQWLEIIKGAMFLTTDNAQAQATLLLGPENILRLEPHGEAAAIDLDDWRAAVDQLVPLAEADFATNRADIEMFFKGKVAPRHRFYTEPITKHEDWGSSPNSAR
jgi:patatin-like phospholipase/acyl hydrolase